VRASHTVTIPESDGWYESLGVEVLHFPYQFYVRSKVATIFNPHDLQHRHLQLLDPDESAQRDALYAEACREARVVVADSKWGRDDIAREYGVAPEKLYAIPMSAPTELYAPMTDTFLSTVKSRYRLPSEFAFYPAQTWAHKNHLRLLEAIAQLRDREGLMISLVCTGVRNEFWRTIQRRVRELRLENQVWFLGFVGSNELRAIYRLAQFVVYPSLFEGGGLPILEAFQEGVPVVCSDVTSLPEYAGDAVLFFDPASVESIAGALRRMNADAALRKELRRRGAERARLFSWDRTAKAYRALYRKVAQYPLSDEEQALLDIMQRWSVPSEEANGHPQELI
jgi:glycosyltransferase involved in cell wall biosynthesis